MPLPFEFNFREPDYAKVFQWRLDNLARIRKNPSHLPALKAFYKENPAQFIIDWGVTTDPRNIERGLPGLMPFFLFPKQEAWIDWIMHNWRNQLRGMTLKSRDMGISWVTVALSCTLCLFHENLVIGMGSRKEEYVDKASDPKSLFHKAREFLSYIPKEFTEGWDVKKHSPNMRILFPNSGSIITGESGTNIGRGNRSSIYWIDEAAYLEQPQLIEASLSATTNCRQDVSTPNGSANPFAQKWMEGKVRQFVFDWRDDPRKDQAWYDKMAAELDPVTLAQEVDHDFNASVEGVLIPSLWVNAAIDAHKKLDFEPTGRELAALDVADEGKDLNALCERKGVLLNAIESWSGKGSDIFKTTEYAFELCDKSGIEELYYDADGVGSAVKGDSNVINRRRADAGVKKIRVQQFRGSASVIDPKGQMVKERRNEDFFANLKAQAWWALRLRFYKTWKMVSGDENYDVDELISLRSDLAQLSQLKQELSQVTYSINGAGKILVDKKPEGTKSPNLADAAMMCYFARKKIITFDKFM